MHGMASQRALVRLSALQGVESARFETWLRALLLVSFMSGLFAATAPILGLITPSPHHLALVIHSLDKIALLTLTEFQL